jgi:radical SAM superfamily enzyme YgiQ (UPF0313 family)
MRALLVQAATPPTYWGYQHSLPFIRSRATLPPLGLATLAAHLPERWELRVRDLHLGPLQDEDLRWADAVLVSGMLVQERSIREALARARRLGRRTVLGGAAATTSGSAFPEATFLFEGEAEGRLDLLVEALEGRAPDAPRVLSPPGGDRPDMAEARVPRFDLLELEAYSTYAIQVSRGCPFSCEFCDVVEVFGRVPRVKSPAQVVAELSELHRLGARGALFLVDDNFIGNRRAAAGILAEMARWQGANGWPFGCVTEASLDLAGEPALLASMADAGFCAVFVGIETPNAAALAETGKKQNLRLEVHEAVRRIAATGLEVFAGFIVGFDSDDAGIFDRQLELISSLPVARAMVGTLGALPGTALWRRLEREGRLRSVANGDQFDRPNFEPTMGERTLVEGYRRLLAALYTDDAYYARCTLALEAPTPARASPRGGSYGAAARAIWRIGVLGRRRRHFWRLLAKGMRKGFPGVERAMTFAILGEHLVRYTEEEVLPRLDRVLVGLAPPAGAVAAAPRANAPAATAPVVAHGAPQRAAASPPRATA